MVLNYNGIINGYPRPLQEIAPSFDAVDAAFTWPSTRRLYIFRVSILTILFFNSYEMCGDS